MKNKTLIAYSSKHGSTADLALRMGLVLSHANIMADVLSVDEVEDLSFYDNVIIGSAVYIGQWQKKAVKLLKQNKEILAGKRVWLFSTGPTGEGDPQELMNGWKFPDALQSTAETIKPMDIKIFHGALDESKLNTLEKMTIKMVKAPMGDFRDWQEVEKWGKEISEAILVDKV